MSRKLEVVVLMFAIIGLSMGFCSKMFATPKKYTTSTMQWYTCNVDEVKSMYTVKQLLGNEYEIKDCVKGMNGFAANFNDYSVWNIAWEDIQKWNNTSMPQNLFLYDMGLGAQKALIIVNNIDGQMSWNNIYMFRLKKLNNKQLNTKQVGKDVERSAKTNVTASTRASDAKEDLEWSEED